MEKDKYTMWPEMGGIRKDRIFPDREHYQYAHLVDDGASIKHMLISGKWYIVTIHPYDMTEYHYAVSDDGRNWMVCRIVGKHPEGFEAITNRRPPYVLSRLRWLDKSLKARIDVS